MRDGILARGVLIDLPALKGVPFVAPGGAITADDFDAWEERTGLRVRPGDVLLVRSGRWSEAATAANVTGSAGIHPSAAAWLHARGVAALGDEGGTDTTPTAVAGINSPLHVLVLAGMGMPLIENLDLEELAKQAAAQNAGRSCSCSRRSTCAARPDRPSIPSRSSETSAYRQPYQGQSFTTTEKMPTNAFRARNLNSYVN
jgi:kynurenine formamidase